MPDSIKGFTYNTEYYSDFFALVKRMTEGVIYMSTSWLTVESPGTNPDCRVVSLLLSQMKLNKCLCTIFLRLYLLY